MTIVSPVAAGGPLNIGASVTKTAPERFAAVGQRNVRIAPSEPGTPHQ